MQEPIRILLVDDHELVRAGIRRFFEKSDRLQVVAEAGLGAEAQQLLTTLSIDVLVVDIKMPDINGIELARWVRKQEIDIKIIIISAYDDEPFVAAAMQAGVNGYLLKSVSPAEAIHAVQRVMQGHLVIDPALTAILINVTHNQPPLVNLTERELDVLQLAANGHTNKEIGGLLTISDRTVQSHLAKIYRKLAVNTRTEAVKVAIASGLISPFTS